MLQSVKSGGSLARNARFGAPTCLVSRHWFDGGFAVSMGEAAKRLLLEGFQEGCHVVLPGAALCDIPACLITCRKCQTWRKSRTKCLFFCTYVSRLESLVFLWRRRVYMGEAAKYVLFEGFQAGCHVVLRACLITCRKCQNWRTSRMKCLFFCAHVFRLESLVFLWRRRVYGGSCKMCPFRRFPSRLSCCFPWQAWHFVTFQPV